MSHESQKAGMAFSQLRPYGMGWNFVSLSGMFQCIV